DFLTQIEAEQRQQDLATPVHLSFKYRLRFVKSAAHVEVLSAEPGEHEDESAFAFFLVSGERTSQLDSSQGAARIFEALTNNGPAKLERAAADLKRVSHVGWIQLGMLGQVRGKSRRRGVKGGFRFRR